MTNGLADTGGSLRLFRAFGIDVYVHWSWFIAAAVMYQVFGADNGFWFLSLYLSLFGIVVLHEFGHALACLSVRGFVKHIVLFPLGGVAFLRPPERPGPTLWTIAAGPLVNVVLVPVLYGLSVSLAPEQPGIGGESALGSYLGALMRVNMVLLVFNVLPIYPLDGGQMVQAVLWFIIGKRRSLQVVAPLGMVLAGLLAVWALQRQQLWLLVISLFIGFQAWNGLRYARYLAAQERGG